MDLTLRWGWCLCVPVFLGCGIFGAPARADEASAAEIASVDPPSGYVDETTPIRIEGRGFTPGSRIGLVDGGPYIAGRIVGEGPCDAVVSHGGLFVVAARNAGLLVVDPGDPENPRILSRHPTPEPVTSIAMSGDIAVAAMGAAGLHLVDLSDPDGPVPLTDLRTGQTARLVTTAGHLAFVAGEAPSLQVIDLSLPSSPEVLGSLDGLNPPEEMVEMDGTLFYYTRFEGIWPIDVRDPNAPRLGRDFMTWRCGAQLARWDHRLLVNCLDNLYAWRYDPLAGFLYNGSVGFGTTPLDVVTEGGVAHAVMRDRLMLIDVDAGAPPSMISWGQFDLTPSSGLAAAAIGPLVAVGTPTGLSLIDAGERVMPGRRGELRLRGYARQVVRSGELAVVADGFWGIVTVDVSDPDRPRWLGDLRTPEPGITQTVALIGDRAYLGQLGEGVQIVDVSDPRSPTWIGEIPGGRWPWQVLSYRGPGALGQWATSATASSEYDPVSFGAIQATGRPDTSECGDFFTAWAPETDGPDPEFLEVRFDTPRHATGIDIHETFIGGFVYRVELIDDAGMSHTVWEGEDDTECPGWLSMEWEATPYLVQGARIHTRAEGWEEIDAVRLRPGGVGDRLLVRDGSQLYLYDATDRDAPELLAGGIYVTAPRDMAASRGDVFVASGWYGLRIYDLSTPSVPELVGSYNPTPSLDQVAVDGDLSVVAGGRLIDVLDVSDRESPLLLGRYQVPRGTVSDLAIDGTMAYAILKTGGLLELDLTDPSSPTLVREYAVLGDPQSVNVSDGVALVSQFLRSFSSIRLDPAPGATVVPSSTEASSAVPPGLFLGAYHLLLSAADGTTTILPNGYRVCERHELSASLDVVEAPRDPLLPASPLWRLSVEGDDLFFEPDHHHRARVLLPAIPENLDLVQLPGDGSGRSAIEVDFFPEAGIGELRLIGDDPDWLEEKWTEAHGLGGFDLPPRDDISYGDLELSVRDSGGAASAPDLTPGSRLLLRFEFAGEALVAARARGAGADLVLVASGLDAQLCETRSTVSFAERLAELCRDWGATSPFWPACAQ